MDLKLLPESLENIIWKYVDELMYADNYKKVLNQLKSLQRIETSEINAYGNYVFWVDWSKLNTHNFIMNKFCICKCHHNLQVDDSDTCRNETYWYDACMIFNKRQNKERTSPIDFYCQFKTRRNKKQRKLPLGQYVTV